MTNQFIFGTSVSGFNFIGRAREIRRIVGRLSNSGQSLAICGEPRIGKTSLLYHLQDPTLREVRYGELAANLFFQYIDAQTLDVSFDQNQFWQIALQPLVEKLEQTHHVAMSAAYDTTKREGFGTFGLERLLAHMQSAGWRLVLLIDEFDNLLSHPVLHQAEFYGSLRSLASRYTSLSLVIASRQNLEQLNDKTSEYSHLGSPYFNFMTQVVLGALEKKDALQLVASLQPDLSAADAEFLYHVAGGQPFLLKTAAEALRDAYDDGEPGSLARWESASRDLYDSARPILKETWQTWSPESRMAVAIVALASLPRLVTVRDFDLDELLSSLPDYRNEVDDLCKRGFLVHDASPESRTGYRLQAQVMLWWLAAELLRVTRPQDEKDLGDWLRAQQWDGLIKGAEKAQLKKALASLGGLLKTGVESFIKASAEGFAKGLAGVK